MINRLKKFIKQLSSLNEKNYSFKLVNFEGKPEEKNLILSYQVTGKATIVSEELAKTVDDLLVLKGFSKKDSEIIYGLAVAQINAPNYRIASVLFDSSGSSLYVEDTKLATFFNIKTLDVFNESSLIDNFDLCSIISIMALCSLELTQKQQDVLLQLRSQIASVPPLRIVK